LDAAFFLLALPLPPIAVVVAGALTVANPCIELTGWFVCCIWIFMLSFYMAWRSFKLSSRSFFIASF